MGRETFELRTTDSLCPPPERQLLEFVKTNNVQKIKRLHKESPGAVNTVIGHPHNKPILHIAINKFADTVKLVTIETLLDCRADLYYSDELHRHKEALHFAVLGENPEILRTIINRRTPETINSLSDGNTALNLLLKEGDQNNPNFVKCIQILLESGIDVNKSDSNDLTPIFWAANKGYKDAVQVILEQSKQDVDLDNHNLRGMSARDYIAEHNWSDVFENLPAKTNGNNNETNNPDVLFGFLKEHNEDAFVGCTYLKNYINANDGLVTLLQTATRKGLKRAVEYLLENGADPNLTTPKTRTTSIEIAATQGYHTIFDLFLKQKRTIISSSILIELLKNIDEEPTSNDVNYDLCYSHLMKYKNKINVNVSDQYNSTPLYYAARYGGAEKTLDLLRAGASMACKNIYGFLPIVDIDANTLEIHLDECLESNVKNNINKDNFTAIFNYKTLMPPKEDLLEIVCDTESANKLIADETEQLPSESDAESDNKLIAHETEESPLESHVESPNKPIAHEIEQLASETQVISYMSKSPELRHLLKHPVITSFLYVKWHRIRWFFYTNLAFYITFCLSLILYILLIFNSSNNQHTAIAYILSAPLFTTFILLFLREMFQIAVAPKTYFWSLENWLELLLIMLTAVILFQKSLDDLIIKQVSAIVILLAAFELVMLIGQHPKMSTNMLMHVMLRTVSTNFFKFLLWYSILIIAFSFSFYTLFGDGGSKFFVNPVIALFKTIVMLTGEFDTGSIHFESYPITSHIIFMIFVILIAIILLNLLNGLAVNDIQLIQSDAELIGHIARIEHIAYIESMFLGNIIPNRVLNVLYKCWCCLPLNINKKFNIPSILVKRVCLYPDFLKDYKMEVYPNQCARVLLTQTKYSESESENCFAHCTNIYLDKQTANRTKQLIKMKKDILEREINEKRERERIIDEQKIILNKLNYIVTNIRKSKRFVRKMQPLKRR